jgi:hypothetical protein
VSPASRPCALWATICGLRGRGTRGQAGGHLSWRAAGARAAQPVNNAARQLGPVRATGKGGADYGSEGTRSPGEARGRGGTARREEPPGPAPPASLGQPGPSGSQPPGQGGAPGPHRKWSPDCNLEDWGSPRSPPQMAPRLQFWSLGAPQIPKRPQYCDL